jgi:hypothetical protein
MLDLGLEHLGVDVGSAGASVTAVLKACGESAHLEPCDYVLPRLSSSPPAALSRLESPETRCPADKAAVLVAAHKNVVGMPPYRQAVVLVIADAVSRWALTPTAYPTEVGSGIREPEES